MKFNKVNQPLFSGIVAAEANNTICSVGIAFNAKIGGIRILDGNVIDALEAKALSHNRERTHIYSAAWGPDDNGRSVDGEFDVRRHSHPLYFFLSSALSLRVSLPFDSLDTHDIEWLLYILTSV